jgi:hypothetical protein
MATHNVFNSAIHMLLLKNVIWQQLAYFDAVNPTSARPHNKMLRSRLEEKERDSEAMQRKLEAATARQNTDGGRAERTLRCQLLKEPIWE